MSTSLSVQSVDAGPILYVRVYGVVDETFDSKALPSETAGRDVILNLKAVSRLTSFGVREWVRAISDLGAQAKRIYLVECSSAIVAQLNMIANFAGTAQVISVQAPFVCEACGWDSETLIDLAKDPSARLPSMTCKRCSKDMAFDDLAESYFAFAKPNSAPIDPSIQAFLRDFESAVVGDPKEREAPSETLAPVALALPDWPSATPSVPTPAPVMEAPKPTLVSGTAAWHGGNPTPAEATAVATEEPIEPLEDIIEEVVEEIAAESPAEAPLVETPASMPENAVAPMGDINIADTSDVLTERITDDDADWSDRPRTQRRRWLIPALAGLAALIVIALAVVLVKRPSAPAPAPTEATVAQPAEPAAALPAEAPAAPAAAQAPPAPAEATPVAEAQGEPPAKSTSKKSAKTRHKAGRTKKKKR